MFTFRIFSHKHFKFTLCWDWNSTKQLAILDLTNSQEPCLWLTHIFLRYCNVLSPGNPTYWSTHLGKIPDLLDLLISNVSSNFIEVEENLAWTLIVILILSEKIIKDAGRSILSLTNLLTGKASRLTFRATTTSISVLERLYS